MNITPQRGSQHERSLRPSDRSSTLELGIRATITHAGIVLYRERAFGADDDVKNRRESKNLHFLMIAYRLAQAAMAHRDTSVSALCSELGISPVTLYRYVGPQGQLRKQGQKVLAT